jgi:hypothetical protein
MKEQQKPTLLIRTTLSVPARLFEAGRQDALRTPSPTSTRKKKPTPRNANLVEAYTRENRPEGLRDFVWIFFVSTVVKILLIPSYRSTDFEVHRNWLAITHSLPMHQWYFENTSEWTLDYPPLFAYFEWFLSQFAQFFDPNMLIVDNLNYSSQSTIVFQRATVIVGDLILLLGILMWSKTWSSTRLTECAHSRGKVAVIGGLTFFNPGLLMVDHIHFQYNGLLMGLLLISVALIRMRRNLVALTVFCILLLMKHIFFYVVPVMGVYLLGHYCWSVVAAGQLRTGLERCRSSSPTKKSNGQLMDNEEDERGSDADSEDSDMFDDDDDDDDRNSSSGGGDGGGGGGGGGGGCCGAKKERCDGCDGGTKKKKKRCCFCCCCTLVECCPENLLGNDTGTKKGRKRNKRRQRTLSEDIEMHVIPGHFKPLHFLALVCIALVSLLVTFGPIIASDVHHEWTTTGIIDASTVVTSTSKQMTQIFSRLFPWGR